MNTKNDSRSVTNFTMRIALTLLVACMPTIQFAEAKFSGPYVPLDKNLDAQWVESLFQKGERKVYRGDELIYINMPCGGIGAGQVGVSGDGRICFTESVYNQMQKPNGGHGLSTGYHYLHPQMPETKVENSFSVIIKGSGRKPKVFKLDKEGFDDIRFIGEYPIAKLDYRKTGEKLSVEISSEVFSPFVPLDLRSSANPVTVLKFSVKNTSRESVEISFLGWLKNIAFPEKSQVKYINTTKHAKKVSGVSFDMQPADPKTTNQVIIHPQLGGFSLSVLDEDANCSAAVASDEEFINSLNDGGDKSGTKKENFISNEPVGGGVSSCIHLNPQETKEVTFLITWFFPNFHEKGKRYGEMIKDPPGWVGRIYNNWYAGSFDVAEYIAVNFSKLYGETKLFRDTYFDNTLPYWLANRITMPVSILAAGNVTIWQNGRMYAYEGIGFCAGTCGHVFNFVTAISKLFPKLERSVRLMQDFNDSGKFSAYSESGRINFRGYGANKPEYTHSYASDAQR